MNQPVDHKVDGLIRFRLDLSYDGTDFAGWAKQPGLRTVQGDLVAALTKIFGESDNDFGLRVAGRTDAGVHALTQVAHIDLGQQQLRRLGRGKPVEGRLNSMLALDLRVASFEPAPPGFDARFSASFRRYRYRIADLAAKRNPLEARYVLWHSQILDLAAMQDAASVLYGLNDFASFCKRKPNATTIRQLREIKITRNEELGGLIEIEIMADAFCHNMVRSIVGALMKVGEHKSNKDDLAATLKRASRGPEKVPTHKTVAPHGLTLIEIGYPADDQLEAQANIARATRSLDDN